MTHIKEVEGMLEMDYDTEKFVSCSRKKEERRRD